MYSDGYISDSSQLNHRKRSNLYTNFLVSCGVNRFITATNMKQLFYLAYKCCVAEINKKIGVHTLMLCVMWVYMLCYDYIIYNV